MKIYELSKIPGIGNEPPKEPDYEAIFASGYSAGYEDGYASVPCYKNQYFTIEMTTSGAVCPHVPTNESLEYRVNGSEWSVFTSARTITVNMEAGDIMEFRGENEYMWGLFECQPTNPEYPDAISGSFITYGNVMSLFYGDGFKGKTAFPTSGNGVLQGLFVRSQVTDASNLVLPATDLGELAYESMFQYCDGLVYAPELPATGLSNSCYSSMFRGTAIETAPELPAATLVASSYHRMFMDCTNINKIKCLATDISANSCLSKWTLNVSSTGTFVKAPGMNDWPSGTSGIPEGWTVVDAS